VDPQAAVNYQQWGNWTGDEGLPEPNNLYGGEYCGCANATEAYQGLYGWADATCSTRGAFICKIVREWRLCPRPAAWPRQTRMCRARRCKRPVQPLTQQPPPGPLPAAPSTYVYQANDTTTFILNTLPTANKAAQRWCNDRGGHLAYYESLEQQSQVEGYYSGLGVLLSTYYRLYWLGLRTNRTSWPDFDWYQRLNPAPSSFNYEHWGILGGQQPDNAAGNEYCVAADAAAAFDGAWGWNDYNCSAILPFVCRLDGALPWTLEPCSAAPAQAAALACLPVAGVLQ
jgi:hypothetical protein